MSYLQDENSYFRVNTRTDARKRKRRRRGRRGRRRRRRKRRRRMRRRRRRRRTRRRRRRRTRTRTRRRRKKRRPRSRRRTRRRRFNAGRVRVLNTPPARMSTGSGISTSSIFPGTTTTLPAKCGFPVMSRLQYSDMPDASTAYTLLAPAIAAKNERMPLPAPTSNTTLQKGH